MIPWPPMMSVVSPRVRRGKRRIPRCGGVRSGEVDDRAPLRQVRSPSVRCDAPPRSDLAGIGSRNAGLFSSAEAAESARPRGARSPVSPSGNAPHARAEQRTDRAEHLFVVFQPHAADEQHLAGRGSGLHARAASLGREAQPERLALADRSLGRQRPRAKDRCARSAAVSNAGRAGLTPEGEAQRQITRIPDAAAVKPREAEERDLDALPARRGTQQLLFRCSPWPIAVGGRSALSPEPRAAPTR